MDNMRTRAIMARLELLVEECIVDEGPRGVYELHSHNVVRSLVDLPLQVEETLPTLTAGMGGF